MKVIIFHTLGQKIKLLPVFLIGKWQWLLFRLKNKFKGSGDFTHIDLQWFSDAEEEGRTEDPTEHKLKESRKEGKVAKSQELIAAVILLFGITVIAILSSFIFDTALSMVRYFIMRSIEVDITTDRTVFITFLEYFLKMTLPVISVAFVAAFLGNVMQVGFLFTTKPITPDFSKLIPKFGKFFKKAFASGEAYFNLLKSLLKIAIIGGIAYLNIRAEIGRIINLVNAPFMQSFGFITSLAFKIIIQAALALLVLSIVDYFFQRRQHIQSLKMSKQEMKEERKTQEGDPLVKSRLRQRMQEIMGRNMIKEVPKADVVITNPTHYAIALQWDRVAMESPTVIAKGVDNIAFKIRDVAKENDVPVMENKPLARALYAEVEIGDTIPEKFYEVIALILAEVYKLNGKQAV